MDLASRYHVRAEPVRGLRLWFSNSLARVRATVKLATLEESFSSCRRSSGSRGNSSRRVARDSQAA